jgi:transcriptional regulator with XRE-family HTH domain
MRQASKLSQEALSDRAETDRTYISSLERSLYNPTIDVVDRPARALGVIAADLLNEDGGCSKTHRRSDASGAT